PGQTSCAVGCSWPPVVIRWSASPQDPSCRRGSRRRQASCGHPALSLDLKESAARLVLAEADVESLPLPLGNIVLGDVISVSDDNQVVRLCVESVGMLALGP